MDAYVLSAELATIRSRTRRIFAFSTAVHLVVGALVYIGRTLAPAEPPPLDFTEITWIEPAEEQIALLEERGAAPSEIEKEKLEKAKPAVPDAGIAVEVMKERLRTMQGGIPARRTLASAIVPPGALIKPARMSAAIVERITGSPARLTRGDDAPAAPAKLERMQRGDARLAAAVPAKRDDEGGKKDLTAKVDLPGVSLAGPVADRDLLSYVSPEYPEWAKRDGVEVSVMLHFNVLPDGTVKEGIIVERSSGFNEFDDNAVHALLAWRFEPIGGGRTSDQWGKIVFNYRLGKMMTGAGS